MNLTREDFIEMAENKGALSPQDAKKLVSAFFFFIKEAIKNGEEVKITNFGAWKSVLRKAKVGRNPQTGEKVIIKARKVVCFKASATLRKKIANIRMGGTIEAPVEAPADIPILELEYQHEIDI